MSAVFKAVEARFEPLSEARLDAVLAIEQRWYGHRRRLKIRGTKTAQGSA